MDGDSVGAYRRGVWQTPPTSGMIVDLECAAQGMGLPCAFFCFCAGNPVRPSFPVIPPPSPPKKKAHPKVRPCVWLVALGATEG